MTDSLFPLRPILLDLFSGAGGCAVGYTRAGFYVIGVDVAPQPHYAGDTFIQRTRCESSRWSLRAMRSGKKSSRSMPRLRVRRTRP